MRETDRTRCWRVFYTAPRAEKKCEARLQAQQLDVFVPKRAVLRQWKDRKKKVIEPLFRSYLFAHVDEAERLRVLQTPGVLYCVSFDSRMAEVSEEEIKQLKITQQRPEYLEPVTYVPARGEHVTVTEGPLRGLKGEVVDHRGQTSIILRVVAIRQAVRVNISADRVTPLR